MQDITHRIRKLMEDKDLTPSEFAKAIGESASKISHLLSGRNNPSLAMILKIQNSFPNVNLSHLILGNSSENQPTETLQNVKMNDAEPTPELASTPEKTVEHITVFYQDGTFKTYLP